MYGKSTTSKGGNHSTLLHVQRYTVKRSLGFLEACSSQTLNVMAKGIYGTLFRAQRYIVNNSLGFKKTHSFTDIKRSAKSDKVEKKMVCRSKRCLGSRLKNIKSNKDDSIVIDDNIKEEVRNEEPKEYQSLQIIYPEDDDEDLREPIGTQIVVYQNQKFVKTDVINEGETSCDVRLNFSSDSDEDNVPIAKRRFFIAHMFINYNLGHTKTNIIVQFIEKPSK
uniref:Uncharacterized protein n=1 Tax=Cucumis melo TaxID=3656 RepID=A0A9I9EEA9_CUCME